MGVKRQRMEKAGAGIGGVYGDSDWERNPGRVVYEMCKWAVCATALVWGHGHACCQPASM